MAFFSLKVRRPNPLTGWLVLAGVASGAIAGWIAAGVYVTPLLSEIGSPSPAPIVPSSSSTSPSVQTIPVVQPSVSASINPPQTLTRRNSSVLAIVKKTAVPSTEELFVNADRAIGQAIALTSDGWLVTPSANMKNVRTADLLVVWQGKSYPVMQAVRDTATDAVYLKIAASGLPSVAFADPQDLEIGMGVWVEPSAGVVRLQTLMDVRNPSSSDPVSSEHATRRYLVNGSGGAATVGGAVWDASGQLIGLVESKIHEDWRVLPASDVRSALSSLLSDKVIRHAVLGVRTIDLGRVAVEGTDRVSPMRGALIRADKKLNAPAIVPAGPASKVLREGDVIERIERDMLDGSADLGEMLLSYKPGTVISIEGQRNGKPFQASVTLGSSITSELIK